MFHTRCIACSFFRFSQYVKFDQNFFVERAKDQNEFDLMNWTGRRADYCLVSDLHEI